MHILKFILFSVSSVGIQVDLKKIPLVSEKIITFASNFYQFYSLSSINISIGTILTKC